MHFILVHHLTSDWILGIVISIVACPFVYSFVEEKAWTEIEEFIVCAVLAILWPLILCVLFLVVSFMCIINVSQNAALKLKKYLKEKFQEKLRQRLADNALSLQKKMMGKY